MASKKKPKTEVIVQTGKKARSAENPASFLSEYPKWQIGRFDSEGPWGMTGLTEEMLLKTIFEKLKSYESMTWGEIDRNKKLNHYVSVEQFVKNARDRLDELKLDEYEELFRFRLGGVERIWGIREGAVFRVLWWDPNHEVSPSSLKHT